MRRVLALCALCSALAPPPPGFGFAGAFGNDMVLQRSPAKAAVYGISSANGPVAVTVVGSGSSYSVDATVKAGTWKALLHPAEAGGSFTITATQGASVAILSRVTFGDVWYCGGQSNMALPLLHTMRRNVTTEAIKAGKYANLRIHGLESNMNPAQPWSTPKDVIAAVGKNPACPEATCQLYTFSSTCWYFGESLTDELGEAAPPIGLVHTSYGGSTIGQWLDNKTTATCRNATLDKSNQEWHDQRVLPYADMSIKGWVWYQGENDMHGAHGNSALGYGYGCLLPALVKSWRALWSATPGTTDPAAPFGFVTLAPSGTEGGNSMGAMRWAQTANYGVAPNPALPNTFAAQAFDLDDPFGNTTCYYAGCCPGNYHPKGTCDGCEGPNQYCANQSATGFYMGPIHPRDKKIVGARLAQVGAVVAYGKKGAATGPTLSGCTLSGNSITLRFNQTLLGGDAVEVQEYSRAQSESQVHVLTNRSLFCLQTAGRDGSECIDDGTGKDIGHGPFDDKRTWVTVDIASSGPNSVTVDLSKSGGVAFAVRYAWGEQGCCEGRPNTPDACPVASCPLMAKQAGLPANPFMAKIIDGKCKCVPPQVCDEHTTEYIV